MSKGKRMLVVFAFIVLALACEVTCLFSLRPAGITISGVRFGVYGCYGDDSGVVPAGSIIITDKSIPVTEGNQAAVFVKSGNKAYPGNFPSAFVGTAQEESGKPYLVKNTGERFDFSGNRAEYISYSITYIGTIFWLIYLYRYVVWGAWVCIFGLFIALLATSPARRRKKYKKQLIYTFNFYGEKYDKEDEGKDY